MAVPEITVAAPLRLTRLHDVAGFACGDAVLDNWLRLRALRRDARAGRTFVACAGARVAGYVCLAAGLVSSPEESAGLRLRPSSRPTEPVPVAILRRLAVDRAFQGRGLGGDLLFDALRRVVATGADLGIRAVLARAVEDSARSFYAAFGFTRLGDDEETLLMPIETVEAALREG